MPLAVIKGVISLNMIAPVCTVSSSSCQTHSFELIFTPHKIEPKKESFPNWVGGSAGCASTDGRVLKAVAQLQTSPSYR